MDLVIGLMAFSVIVLFLGALNYFLGRNYSDTKSKCDTTNQQRSSNRRKHARNANKKQRASNDNLNSNNDQKDQRETESISTEIKNEEEEKFEDTMKIEDEEEKPILPVQNNSMNSKSTSTLSNEESISSLKPQASIAPVKQSLSPIPKTNIESTQILEDKYSKSNGHLSPRDTCFHSKQKSLPPRFQQQQQQRQRRSKGKKNDLLTSPQNDFLQQLNKSNQLELPLESLNHNGYSSESDNLTGNHPLHTQITSKTLLFSLESSSITPTFSTESQSSSSSSNLLFDELISIFDSTSFNSDELALILSRLTTKHMLNKQAQQRLTLTNKNENTIGRLLDETCRSQTKILAIELQNEKTRVAELAKTNAEMEQTIRQLQQPNNNMITYQQTILHYQMQIQRMTDDNARLAHQLHAYSLMPASINQLKQQQIILSEQLRQITARNNHLEKEIADGQQASRQAAEIYQKSE